jgi:diguanylate cyclase (GGDEF)-like protein
MAQCKRTAKSVYKSLSPERPKGKTLLVPAIRVQSPISPAATAVDHARSASTTTKRPFDLLDRDELTGLGSRYRMAGISATSTDSVAMIDLDRFRRLNEVHGRAAGDRVLIAFGKALRKYMRPDDLLFRIGGEEFFIIMPDTAPSVALEALAHLHVNWVAERPLPISFSAGVAGVECAHLNNALKAADEALYSAKSAGRDRFKVTGMASRDTVEELSGQAA